ncbi:MAG TPA: hypothetical protein PKH65_02045 [Bacteroidia bacterium]|nr:hypothetical protein [Bacteroidia bacterium]HNT79436.1 hypothetical protein [Bacteroidia bacterium]
MSNRRRIIIITISVLAGTLLSYFIIKMKRGGAELSQADQISIIGNFIISLAVILGIGFIILWNKNKNDL